MKRRTFLVGLGTFTAGSGAVLGSGALTTVEAPRTAAVQTAGDESTLLQLIDASGSSYVTVESNGQRSFKPNFHPYTPTDTHLHANQYKGGSPPPDGRR